MKRTSAITATCAAVLFVAEVSAAAANGRFAQAMSACVARTEPAAAIASSVWLDVSPGAVVADPDPNYTLWWLSDALPQPDGRLGQTTLSAVYDNVINDHEPALPRPTAAARERERRAFSLLVHRRPWIVRLFRRARPAAQPSRKLVEYRRHASEYRLAQARFNNAATVDERMHWQDAMRRIDEDWILAGFKREVDEAFEIIRSLHVSAPGRWQEVARRYVEARRSTAGGSRYLPTVAVPPYASWSGSEGWIACAAPDGERLFEYKLVRLQRPWFDREALFSRQWRWSMGSPYAGNLVSDGVGGESETPGWAPLLPDELILVRNASIEVTPGVRMTTSSTPRLGGWVVTRARRSPDPLPDLAWPSDGLATRPQSAWRVTPAVIAAVTWTAERHSFSDTRKYPLAPNPAMAVSMNGSRVGGVLGLGLGPTLRGTGLVAGVSVGVTRTTFAFGGVRLPVGSTEPLRWVTGMGVRLLSAHD